MTAELLLDLRKALGLVGGKERNFCLRIFEEIGYRLDLAMRIERYANRSVIERPEIGDRPGRVIFTDKCDTIAERDPLFAEPIGDSTDFL